MTNKLDLDKPYRCRDGRPAGVARGPGERLYGWFEGVDGNPCLGSWEPDGSWLVNRDHQADLVNTPPRHKRTIWVNVYDDARVSATYLSKKFADEMALSDRIACLCVDLDFEEGEGLE